MLPPFLITLYQIANLLEALEIPYLVGGSVASSALSEYRSTNDIDVVVDLTLDKTPALVDVFGEDYYYEPELIRDAIVRQDSFNVLHFETMLKIDFFIKQSNAWFDEQFARRQKKEIGTGEQSVQVWLPTAEDVILQKLAWYRLGGEVSDRQWRDVQGVLKIQAVNLDFDYLSRWAAFRGITDLLARAMRDAADYLPKLPSAS